MRDELEVGPVGERIAEHTLARTSGADLRHDRRQVLDREVGVVLQLAEGAGVLVGDGREIVSQRTRMQSAAGNVAQMGIWGKRGTSKKVSGTFSTFRAWIAAADRGGERCFPPRLDTVVEKGS